MVGGDGMIALGANAVGCSGKPLGIVATGSGNDFARGLKLPVNRIETAVEGIVGAIVRGSHIDVDMGRVTSLDGGYAWIPPLARSTSTRRASPPSIRLTGTMRACCPVVLTRASTTVRIIRICDRHHALLCGGAGGADAYEALWLPHQSHIGGRDHG